MFGMALGTCLLQLEQAGTQPGRAGVAHLGAVAAAEAGKRAQHVLQEGRQCAQPGSQGTLARGASPVQAAEHQRRVPAA